jgi:hypothetical protein
MKDGLATRDEWAAVAGLLYTTLKQNGVGGAAFDRALDAYIRLIEQERGIVQPPQPVSNPEAGR